MRPLLPCLGLACLLGGCQQFYDAAGVLAGLDVASLTIIGRTVPDAIVSLIRNRDCSAVRLEQGRSYCVPADPAPPPAEFCTHSLGSPDCWAEPALLPGHPRPLADTPAATPAQIADRAHRWPDL